MDIAFGKHKSAHCRHRAGRTQADALQRAWRHAGQGEPYLAGDVVHQQRCVGTPEVEVADAVVLFLASRVPDLKLQRRSTQLHHLREERTWNQRPRAALPGGPGLHPLFRPGRRQAWAQRTIGFTCFLPPTARKAEQTPLLEGGSFHQEPSVANNCCRHFIDAQRLWVGT